MGAWPCVHAPSDIDERFAETAWSIVLAAGAETPARAREGMAQLCSIYWRPIYAYLRRIGYAREEAEDLTQSFFQHLLENDTIRRASREKGRFRSFLLGALKVCLSDEQARRRTLKRGGGAQFISTDELEAEELHHLRVHHEAAPDEILDARWASVILERALTKVSREFSAEGKAETFEAALALSFRRKSEHLIRASSGDNRRLVRRDQDAYPSPAPPIRCCRAPRDHADGEHAARSG